MDDRTMAQTKKKKAKERTPQITLLDRTNESISLDELTRTADENASYDVSISSSAGSSSSSNNNNNSNNNDNSSSRNTSCSSNCSRSSNTNSSISKTSSVGLGRPKRGTMAMVRSNETHGTEVDESGNDDDNDSDENHRDSRVSASQKLHRCVEEAAHNRRRVPQRLEHAAATHHHAPQRSGKAAAASMARREGGNQPKVVQKLPPRSRAPERSRRSRLASHDDDETAESDDESPSNVEEQTEVDDADEEKRQLNELLTSICPELLAEFFCFLDERYMFSPFAGLLCLECNVKLNFSFGGHDGYRTGPMEAIQWHEKNHHEDDMKDLSDRQKAVKSLRCRFHTFASSYASWDTEDRRKVLLRYTLGSGDLLQCWLCDQCGQCVHYADNTHQARNGGACSGGSYIDTEGHFHRWWKLDKSSYPPILPKDFTPEDILCLLHPDIRQLIRSAGGQSVAELYSNVCLSHYNESECIGSGGYKHVIAFPVPSRKEDKPMQVAALVDLMPNLTSGGRPLSRGQSSSGQYDNSYLENHDYALREVETMVALNELRCPHLVKILTTKYATCPETRAARRFLFIEMEYANRGDLEAYMDATYPYPSHRPAPVIKSLFFQAIIGLHAFTSRGMVHLDIKPTNIFVDKRGDDAEPIKWYRIGGVNKRLLTSLDAILGDFGRARKLPENSQLLPFTMEHVSTYEYVAPEIGFFGDSAIVTPSMDMFAMGLTLFSLAAGKDYCDMMNAVECPAALKKRWMEIWNTEGYSVVKELAAQVASEIPKRPQLHDTLYRHVVVFGLKTQGRTAQSEAWKAALEMLGPGGPDEKQFKEHVATFDLKDGIDLCLEYTRSALGEKGLELLSGLCSFEPDERPTSSQALAYIYFNDFNRTKKEKEPFYFELETGNS